MGTLKMTKAELEKKLKIAKAALAFYGDPMTYFAISIFSDPPCGEFVNDYGKAARIDGVVEYFPGARARSTLRKLK